MIEIRWHGRGGQGAKTASLLLAEAAFSMGKFIQGFPEYGPERMGAPITAFNRISERPITVHSNIYEPDYVVVTDETLLASVPVTAGLKAAGGIIVNSPHGAEEVRKNLEGYEGRVVTVDAKAISEQILHLNFPNTSMLAAIVKVSSVMSEDEFLSVMESSFKHKFASKPNVVEGNISIVRRTFREVGE